MDKQKGPVGDFIRENARLCDGFKPTSPRGRARAAAAAPAYMYGPAARPGRATQAQNVNEWTTSD